MTEVSCAIIIDRGRVLATRRSENMPHPLKWEFPGGKVKDAEKPEVCIVREIREELGIEVKVERGLRPVIHHYSEHSIKLLPFVCHILEGIISLTEHMEYSWIAPAKLDEVDWLEADVEVAVMAKEVFVSKEYSQASRLPWSGKP